jgi:cytochrome c-type biogenesis protein
MTLFFLSFFAGALTVLAPCILPILPVIVGGSLGGARQRNPYVLVLSLALAIVLFTLILKWSTVFIDIPQGVWSSISAGIIILFGLSFLFPGAWDRVNVFSGFGRRSDEALVCSSRISGLWGDVAMGAALGPVFSSCSPTYFLILATVLPADFVLGLIYLVAYALGLSAVLLPLCIFGQRLGRRLQFVANPRGWFKRGLGLLFLLVGIAIATGADKWLQTAIVEGGYVNSAIFEQQLLDRIDV